MWSVYFTGCGSLDYVLSFREVEVESLCTVGQGVDWIIFDYRRSSAMKEAPRSITIFMDYIGKELSVNHYLGRRRDGGTYVKEEVKEWMWILGWMIKEHHIEDWKLPLEVTCNGQFRDNRIPDISNLSKCTLDAIEDVTRINDRYMRWHDGNVTIKRDAPPMLQIIIEEAI